MKRCLKCKNLKWVKPSLHIDEEGNEERSLGFYYCEALERKARYHAKERDSLCDEVGAYTPNE